MNSMRDRLAIAACVLAVAIAGGILAESEPREIPVEIRRTQECVVLYTIHRGSFDKIGAAIGEAIGAGAKKGVYPAGSISFAYLNNFDTTPEEHWLTEIRIPVGNDALKLAGTLGKFTDVKKLPSVEVVVAIKPEGFATPGRVYQRLYAWMFENTCMPTERPSEVFLTNAQIGDYSKMRSEIMIAVRKMSPPQE
ncbi:MAG: GyrI-like domain-containing protein [Sedimentisphaerales bacterium]|nr:GyrI-like domain-containing protein [Sedimentisphaerales bacterium]